LDGSAPIYYWSVKSAQRASFKAQPEYWRDILHGVSAFPAGAVGEIPLVFEEETGDDVPVLGVLPLADFVRIGGYCRPLSSKAREVLGEELASCGRMFREGLNKSTDHAVAR
jgi:hypothetical protein